jgi:hypothetical protein
VSGVAPAGRRAFKGFTFTPGRNPSNRIKATNFRHMNNSR